MKKVIGTMLFVLAVAMFSTFVFAQPNGQVPGGPGNPGASGGRERNRTPGSDFGFGSGVIGQLTNNTEIKNRLGLNEEQVSKLTKLSEELRPPRRERQQSGIPSREDMQKFREEAEKRIDESLAKINQILNPEQQEKLKILQFQLVGGLDSPFLNVRNLEVLNLTDEQKAKLKAINEQRLAETREALEKVDWRNSNSEEREKLRAENEVRAKKFADQIKAILTPEQKEKAEKLTAEAKEVQEKVGIRARNRGDRRNGENRERGEVRPDQDSWQPGQGTGERRNQNRQPRRAFPQNEQKE
ncbi:MAG: Spy/CpxP family protein refolding chaperone [Planctomycetaceae bacterium]|jgi:Spy/CpxP family protein refolding chaperone|nr:Spy/CpxP family protein refolding chaperone [Planctomycetaceae bacterium]